MYLNTSAVGTHRRSISTGRRQTNARRKTMMRGHKGQSTASRMEESIFHGNNSHIAPQSKRKKSISSRQRTKEQEIVRLHAMGTDHHQQLLQQMNSSRDKTPDPSSDRLNSSFSKRKRSNFGIHHKGLARGHIRGSASRPVSPLQTTNARQGKSRSMSSHGTHGIPVGDTVDEYKRGQFDYQIPSKSHPRKPSDSLSEATPKNAMYSATRELFTLPTSRGTKSQSRRQSMVKQPNILGNGMNGQQPQLQHLIIILMNMLPAAQRQSVIQAVGKPPNLKIGTFHIRFMFH